VCLKGVVLTLRELGRAELPEAANLLARGMCDNPIIIRVFRISDTERRVRALERFFVSILRGLHQRGLVCGAFCDGSLVGVCGMGLLATAGLNCWTCSACFLRL
jgi:hypothetical protein